MSLSARCREFEVACAARQQSLLEECSNMEEIEQRLITFQQEKSDRAREDAAAYKESLASTRKAKLEAEQQAKQRMTEGKKELKELKKLKKEVKKDIDSLCNDLHRKIQILDEETKATANQEEERAAKADKIGKNLQKILDTFHLHFRNVKGGRIQAVFTHVDHDDHERNCFFLVKLLDGKLYEVTETNPAVPDIDELVAELNASNNFSRFVCTIRKRFQMAIEEEKKLS